jgi:methanogenic corrinoid protein MtbC1
VQILGAVCHMTDVLEDLGGAIGKLDSEEHVKTLLSAALSQGFSASEIVEKGVRKGLQAVGEKYEAGEYFLSELLYAGSLVEGLLRTLKPRMSDQELERKGVIVLGTVRGDIHDIGKNIFKMLADSSGFEVHDLGVDVDPAAFVDEVKKSTPDVLGLSALLTTTLVEMKSTVEVVRRAGVKSNLKILLGGNAVKKEFASQIGADAGVLDAVEGLEVSKRWMQK